MSSLPYTIRIQILEKPKEFLLAGHTHRDNIISWLFYYTRDHHDNDKTAYDWRLEHSEDPRELAEMVISCKTKAMATLCKIRWTGTYE